MILNGNPGKFIKQQCLFKIFQLLHYIVIIVNVGIPNQDIGLVITALYLMG